MDERINSMTDDIIELEAEVVEDDALVGEMGKDVATNDDVGKRVIIDLKNDKLCVAVKSGQEDNSLYDVILQEIAEEAANLKGLGQSVPGNDLVSAAIISEKRIATLKKAADLVNARTKSLKDRNGGKIDFHGEGFKAVMEYLTKIIVEATNEAGLEESTAERLFLRLKSKFVGFEEIAESLYKGDTLKTALKKTAENKMSFGKGQRDE